MVTLDILVIRLLTKSPYPPSRVQGGPISFFFLGPSMRYVRSYMDLVGIYTPEHDYIHCKD